MARFRRVTPFTGRSSYKNVIDTAGSLAANTDSVTTVAAVVDPVNLDTLSNEMPTNGRLSAIFYTLYVYSASSVIGLVNVYWYKRLAGDPPGTGPTPGSSGSSDLKRFIIHEEKGLSGGPDGTAMIVKGVLKLPKKLSLFSSGENLDMVLRSDVTGQFCAKHIYRVIY